MTRPLIVERFPVTQYRAAWRWQLYARDAVLGGENERLALLQHPPVYTFGRRVHEANLLLPRHALESRGAEVVESDRGGDVTFHGPGQLVGYPILDLRSRQLGAREYVHALEEVLISSLQHLRVAAFRLPSRPGVWTDRGKIGAIGVRVQGGVSTHGFALNVDVDLSWFDAIVPCGLKDASVTSIAGILGPQTPSFDEVREVVALQFAGTFDCEPVATLAFDLTAKEAAIVGA